MDITDRFDQPGYAIYEKLHELPLEATEDPIKVQGTEDTVAANVKRVSKLYEDNIDMPRLRDQIIMLRSILPNKL